MNLLDQAQYEYLRNELKKVIIDLQGIVEWHTKQGNTEKAKAAEANILRIANYAGYAEKAIKTLEETATCQVVYEVGNTTEDAIFYDKEYLRNQSKLQLECDMPHLFQPYSPKTYVAQ